MACSSPEKFFMEAEALLCRDPPPARLQVLKRGLMNLVYDTSLSDEERMAAALLAVKTIDRLVDIIRLETPACVERRVACALERLSEKRRAIPQKRFV